MPFADRHRRVLETAMELMSEAGVAGASLRDLAARVGVQQPSLYNYFASKAELVGQILDMMAERTAEAPLTPPARLEDLPGTIVRLVQALYDDPGYVHFVRFAFAVAAEEPQHRPRLQELFLDRFEAAGARLTAPFVASGELTPAEAKLLVGSTSRAVALMLIERRLLFGEPGDNASVEAYVRFVAESAVHALRARRAPPTLPARPRRRKPT